MAFSIQTNVNSLIAQENLRVNGEFQSRTINRLTSGFRINASGDDAAGLAVANKFRSDVAELQQGVRNANDGLSTLQIIDGGLNNISKILDRLKTLATQSASSTFDGNRATLNNEYQDLLKEIDRQAANIGLGSGSFAGRFNTNIMVYTGGGGDAQANSKVSVDLSGSANKVDAAGLLLNGTNVAAGGATAMAASATNLDTGAFLSGSATQTFKFHITTAVNGAFDVDVAVTGDGDGISGSEVVSQLNNALNRYGVSASIGSGTNQGKLMFSGDVAFSASVAGVAGGVTTDAATAGKVSNDAMYTAGGASVAFTAGADTLTFKVGANTASVALAGTDTVGTALQKLNSALNPLGIYAVKDTSADGTTTTNIKFESSAAFTYASSGTAIFGAVTAETDATGPSGAVGSVTSAAESAITKLTESVKALGLIQGTVGTGQNKLQYAIQLAQSQISNFSAAESRIRDADVAAEAANLTKAQVLQQASLAAMAQANSAPQAVLALLRG